jgi:hypothetical protein
VRGIGTTFPLKPKLSRSFGIEIVFDGESKSARKILRALAD